MQFNIPEYPVSMELRFSIGDLFQVYTLQVDTAFAPSVQINTGWIGCFFNVRLRRTFIMRSFPTEWFGCFLKGTIENELTSQNTLFQWNCDSLSEVFSNRMNWLFFQCAPSAHLYHEVFSNRMIWLFFQCNDNLPQNISFVVNSFMKNLCFS